MGDVLGWLNTRWGMSEDEVAFSLSAMDVETGAVAKFGKGLYSPMVIRNLPISHYLFDAQPQFDEKTRRLEQVLLSHEAGSASEVSIVALTANAILTEKFGIPARDGTTDDFIWDFPSTRITLSSLIIESIGTFSTYILFARGAPWPRPVSPAAF